LSFAPKSSSKNEKKFFIMIIETKNHHQKGVFTMKKPTKITVIPTNTPLVQLDISANTLSPFGGGIFQCTDVRLVTKRGRQYARLRVLLDDTTGQNITVPFQSLTDVELYHYLRYLIKNRPSVHVRFETVHIRSNPFNNTLYLTADSWELLNSAMNPVELISILNGGDRNE
jgi:hypothetical protein